MISFLAGIIAGIAIGWATATFVIIWDRWRSDQYEGDLADLIVDIEPVETPFMSVIERHRQKHLAARGGDFDGTGTGVRRRDP